MCLQVMPERELRGIADETMALLPLLSDPIHGAQTMGMGHEEDDEVEHWKSCCKKIALCPTGSPDDSFGG